MDTTQQTKLAPKTSGVGSESGHWYNADGLVKSVPLASGKGMTTRITAAHARKFGLVPSVTGILKIIDKPNLTVWKCKEYVRAAGYVGAMGKDEQFDDYFKRVSEQFDRYNDHAAVGTDIHAQKRGGAVGFASTTGGAGGAEPVTAVDARTQAECPQDCGGSDGICGGRRNACGHAHTLPRKDGGGART